MRHEHQCHLLLLVEPHDEIEYELRIYAVEVARGFIGNEHGRAIGKAPSYGDTLPLSAGELGGKMVEAMLQPDSLEQFAMARSFLSDRGRFVSNIGICTFSTAVNVGSR